MANEFDAHKYLTYAAPPDPTKYKPNFGDYATDVLGYANSRHDKSFEQDMEKQRLAREVSRDTNADERDRVSQAQRARQMISEDKRAGQREDLYATQEQRRQADAIFNRNKMLQQEHEALIQELYQAINTPGQDALTRQNRIKAAQDALKRAGYGVNVNEDTPNGPTLPPPVLDAQPQAAPAPPTEKQHLSPKETASTSSALDKASSSYLGKLAPKGSSTNPKPKAKPSGQDASLNRQLDEADQTYSKGLGVTPWLPGQSATGRVSPQVTKSDMMLSPDDPYNDIVK